MQKRKLGKSGLEVSALGLGCMSIAPTTDRPQTETKALRSFVQPMKKASRSSIPPKFTARIRTKSLSEKRSRLSATKSLSQPNSVMTLKQVVLIADQSTSRK